MLATIAGEANCFVFHTGSCPLRLRNFYYIFGQVLDLMVRMLGFSDEDKQRIGVAQHGAGKGVVRGVLGLPGRLVGGILGGGSAESAATMASENQVIIFSKD